MGAHRRWQAALRQLVVEAVAVTTLLTELEEFVGRNCAHTISPFIARQSMIPHSRCPWITKRRGGSSLNLLSNSVKFTPHGGRIDVRCEGAGDRVSLHVTDTGIGIPAERLESVFEPFVQVHRTLKDPTGGVGLGLAISRDLARGMGGELSVQSAGADGSTFTLTLPRALQ